VSSTGNIEEKLPGTAWKYGQHFYCYNLNDATLATVINHLDIIEPNVYYSSGVFKNLKQSQTNYLVDTLSSSSSEKTLIFSKNPNKRQNLYEDIIAPYLGANVVVESWVHPSAMPASCPSGKPSVTNVQQVKFANGDSWETTNDHSKWAVTSGAAQYGCMCDINHVASQAGRGGSCICSSNANLFKAMTAVVNKSDSCSKSKSK